MVRQYHAAHLELTHRDALFALGWVNRFSSYLVAMSLGPARLRLLTWESSFVWSDAARTWHLLIRGLSILGLGQS